MSAHVQRINAHAFQVACPEHPHFVRVAWTRPTVPTESAQQHNATHHNGAPVEIIDAPSAHLRTMLAGAAA